MEQQGVPLSELKVLVVEDSEDLTAIWRALFRREGIAARFCNSGALAISVIEADYQPNVVMTDYYLPDITGLELVSEIRKRAPKIDCLMVTGNHDDAFVSSVAQEKVPLLFKPVRFPDLLAKLASLAKVAAHEAAEPPHSEAGCH